jgi:hypothetical protein
MTALRKRRFDEEKNAANPSRSTDASLVRLSLNVPCGQDEYAKLDTSKVVQLVLQIRGKSEKPRI